jgi:hypothetical protein
MCGCYLAAQFSIRCALFLPPHDRELAPVKLLYHSTVTQFAERIGCDVLRGAEFGRDALGIPFPQPLSVSMIPNVLENRFVIAVLIFPH